MISWVWLIPAVITGAFIGCIGIALVSGKKF